MIFMVSKSARLRRRKETAKRNDAKQRRNDRLTAEKERLESLSASYASNAQKADNEAIKTDVQTITDTDKKDESSAVNETKITDSKTVGKNNNKNSKYKNEDKTEYQKSIERQHAYDKLREKRKKITRAIIGGLVAAATLIPVGAYGVSALVMTANNSLATQTTNTTTAATNDNSETDITKMTKEQREEILNQILASYSGLQLTDKEKQDFIDNAVIPDSLRTGTEGNNNTTTPQSNNSVSNEGMTENNDSNNTDNTNSDDKNTTGSSDGTGSDSDKTTENK